MAAVSDEISLHRRKLCALNLKETRPFEGYLTRSTSPMHISSTTTKSCIYTKGPRAPNFCFGKFEDVLAFQTTIIIIILQSNQMSICGNCGAQCPNLRRKAESSSITTGTSHDPTSLFPHCEGGVIIDLTRLRIIGACEQSNTIDEAHPHTFR